MAQGFPRALVDYVLCVKDGGHLLVERADAGTEQTIFRGIVKCAGCGSLYEIKEGILDMFLEERLTNESNQYEMEVRDREAGTISEQWEQAYAIANAMEIPSTLKHLGSPSKIRGFSILELGCGTGRYTKLLAQKSRFVLAVDFSWQSLVVNLKMVDGSENVGFVHADISKLKLRPESFDLALSTFYSNLPSYDIRVSSTKVVATALRKGGRYVLSAHHHHPLEIRKGIPASRTYDNGIFYLCFTAKELKEEMRHYFKQIKTDTVCIWIPRISRIEKTRVLVSRVSERIPLLNRLGSILLATAIKGCLVFLYLMSKENWSCFWDGLPL